MDTTRRMYFLYSMKSNATTYSLGVRLAHLSWIILLPLLLLTGLRLAWYDHQLFSAEINRFLDALTLTGKVFFLHALSGILFLVGTVFYLLNLHATGESRRLLLLFFDKTYSFKKKILYLFTVAMAGMSFLSGVTLYSGLYIGVEGYLLMKYLHYYSAVYLVGFTFFHIIEVFSNRQTNVAALFWGERRPGWRNDKVVLVTAGVALLIGGIIYFLLDWNPTLHCQNRNRSITIDGREREIEWLGVDSVTMEAAWGNNFADGTTRITVKSFHDKRYIYFLIRWSDRTRSYNRHLVKTDSGWEKERSAYPDIFGESIYAEDKVALSFRRDDDGCASTCHIRTNGKAGFHYTGGDTIDVWQWMAVSTNPAWEAEDGWWGKFVDDSVGGRHLDNLAKGSHRSNLNEEWKQPYFLPTHWTINNWIWFGSNEYLPYHPELDTFAVGARLPGVLVAPTTGDRGDVQARGHWRNGVWTVEFARLLTTGSPVDVVFKGTVYLGIAPFDNAENKHAFHLPAIKLTIE